MSQRLCRQWPALVHWCQAPPDLQGLITKHVSPDLMKALCECVVNLFAGNIPMTPQQRQTLVPHTKMLMTLMKKNVSLAKKKKLLLQQKGKGLAGLGALISLGRFTMQMAQQLKGKEGRINGKIVRRPMK